MTPATRRRIMARHDTRALLSAPWASEALERFYAHQQTTATANMQAHDRLKQPVRLFDTIAGNERVAMKLVQIGVRTPTEAETKVREMLEMLPKPQVHVR